MGVERGWRGPLLNDHHGVIPERGLESHERCVVHRRGILDAPRLGAHQRGQVPESGQKLSTDSGAKMEEGDDVDHRRGEVSS